MKKQFQIFAATFITVALISCSKEKIETEQPNNFGEIATAKGGQNGLPPVSNKGLLGRFEFNGDLKDATAQLADGVSTVGRVLYTTDRKGQVSKAIRFNAAYGVNIFNVPSTPDGATMSVWVQHDTLPTPGWISSVFSFKGFILQQSFNFFAGSYQTGLVNAQQIVQSSSGTDKKWHHMAVTRDNNELKFYIDGVLIGTAPTPAGTGPFDPTNNYSLGGAYDIYWKGALDDLRFYQRVLTAAEINTLANS
jgi:hypothetical protein